jgi:hypothetical protein
VIIVTSSNLLAVIRGISTRCNVNQLIYAAMFIEYSERGVTRQTLKNTKMFYRGEGVLSSLKIFFK